MHGFLGSGKLFNSLANSISQHAQVIVPDLPGHGYSGNLGYIHEMEFMADCIHALCRELQLEKVFLLGHSMGGYVALAFAERFPENFDGIGLLNSIPFADSEEKKLERSRAIMTLKSNHNVFLHETVVRLFSGEHLRTNKKHIKVAEQVARKTSQRGMIAALEGMKSRKDRTEVIKKNSSRVFMIQGKNDRVFSTEAKKKISLIIKKAHYFELEKSGHMSFLEESEETEKIIWNILAKTSQ